MKRFIYSGCSFTSWARPTWADIIAYDKISRGEIDCAYNLANKGSCNYFIMSSLLMAKSALNITSDDLIGIAWTSPWRHSLMDPKTINWLHHGGVGNHPIWNKVPDHFDTINNELYLLERTATSYQSVQEIFDVDFELKLPIVLDLPPNDIYTPEDVMINLFGFIPDNISDPTFKYNQSFLTHVKKNIYKFLEIPDFKFTQFEGTELKNEIYGGHPTLKDNLLIAQSQTDLLDSTIKIFSKAHNNMEDLIESFLQENKSIEESRCRLNELMIYDHLHNNPHYGDIEIWKKICFYENDRAELNIFGA